MISPERPKILGNFSGENDPKLQRQMREIRFLESALASRAELAGKLGMSFGGDRDLYSALGYSKSPDFNDYYAKYKRHGISKRVVNAPVEASWRKKPKVSDNLGPDQTPFEKAWKELVKKHKIWHYLARADRLSGIGKYGVLYMGFDDTDDPSKPLSSGNLIYLRPYSEGNATISKYSNETKDSRYGYPIEYSLIAKKNADSGSNLPAKKVHYSRIIHIAEGLDSDDVFGTPRLEAVLNDVTDIEKVVGGSAEMFWRGAFPGMALTAAQDASMDTMDQDDLEDEIQAYIHKMQRYIRLQGIELKELAPQVSDPTAHFMVLIQSISSATHIPKRILIGSERGELASSQDEINWGTYIDTRRQDHVEPQILRPFIDAMISAGVLPEPENDYTIIWPDVTVPTPKEEAEVARIRVDTLNKYVSGIGSPMVVPEKMFLSKFLDFTDEDILQAENILDGEIKLEQQDANAFSRAQSQETDLPIEGESAHGEDGTKAWTY